MMASKDSLEVLVLKGMFACVSLVVAAVFAGASLAWEALADKADVAFYKTVKAER